MNSAVSKPSNLGDLLLALKKNFEELKEIVKEYEKDSEIQEFFSKREKDYKKFIILTGSMNSRSSVISVYTELRERDDLKNWTQPLGGMCFNSSRYFNLTLKLKKRVRENIYKLNSEDRELKSGVVVYDKNYSIIDED